MPLLNAERWQRSAACLHFACMNAAIAMNRLQRWYFGWAEKYYARMAPELRCEAERVDRLIYSRRGAPIWLAAAAMWLALSGLLWWADMPPLVAVLVAAAGVAVLLMSLLAAWLKPQKFAPKVMLRLVLVSLLLGYLGSVIGLLIGRIARRGWPDAQGWWEMFAALHQKGLPLVIGVVLLMLLAMAAVAAVRHWQSERELAALKLQQAQDAAARQAAESRLHLLQAQIEPHFIFNTLAAVQHWVDTADPRAGPLLRSLTTFLRASTELLGRDELTLADELPVAREYLAIMKARVGDRLRFECDLDDAALAQPLPPGILLTLVENAVEHGVCCSLHGSWVAVQARHDADGGFVLAVRNGGEPLPADWRDGLGLSNTRQRLAHRFGDRARLSLAADGPAHDPHTVAELRIAPALQEVTP